MATRTYRLVERLQQRQQAQASRVLPGLVSARDVAELESRMARLRRVSDSFAYVRLSEYVAPRGAAKMPVSDGAICVATDV